MHFNNGEIPLEYSRHIRRKCGFLVLGLVGIVTILIYSIGKGPVNISIIDVVKTLSGETVSSQFDLIIWNIRLSQAIAAIVAGSGLAICGAVMQAVLRNPLGSPFTLGISHAAAFGAAFSVMVLDIGSMSSLSIGTVTIDHSYITTVIAFSFSMLATGIIIGISRLRKATPETMILAGVALSSLFTAGTMFLQYFADDMQLASMVFWTFGDVGRASWQDVFIIGLATALSYLWFTANRWNFNAIEAGDETAKGLGVKVEQIRIVSMFIASFVTAVIVSLLGIIGFIGLVCPHIVRKVIGDDYRFLLPGACLVGSVLLLAADTGARLILAPNVIPVSIFTAFFGAPVFIWLIIRGR